MFYPTKELTVTPDQVGLQYDNVQINVKDDESVHGWYFDQPVDQSKGGERRVLLFCHGNGGNISNRLETILFLQEIGVSLLIFDYRGYGQSDGEFGEENMYQDALTSYRWLIDEKGWQSEQIILFGRSLGGAIVVDLATKVKAGGVIVESSFTAIGDMASKMYPWLPVRYLLKYQFSSIDKIADLTCPILIAHSQEDSLVPYEMGRRLFEVGGDKAQFVELSGDHDELAYLQSSTYRSAIRQFIFQ